MMATANFTSLLTTMPPIKLQKSIAGCYVTHASTFTSPLLAVPGSTWSSVSLLVSPPRPFAGEASLRCDNFKPLLTPTSPSITKTPTLLLGPPPQILSSENSNAVDGCSVDHESWGGDSPGRSGCWISVSVRPEKHEQALETVVRLSDALRSYWISSGKAAAGEQCRRDSEAKKENR